MRMASCKNLQLLLLLGFLLLALALISSHVEAAAQAEVDHDASTGLDAVEPNHDVKQGYGGGYGGRGGGYGGGGYGGRGGGYGGGGYGGGGYGGGRGGGYGGGGYGGGRGGGGGHCRYGCCGHGYGYGGGCKCCVYAGEVPNFEAEAQPHN